MDKDDVMMMIFPLFVCCGCYYQQSFNFRRFLVLLEAQKQPSKSQTTLNTCLLLFIFIQRLVINKLEIDLIDNKPLYDQ